jgi:molecular chaperone GrpE
MSLSDNQGERPEANPAGGTAPKAKSGKKPAADREELENQLAEKTQEAQENYERLLRYAAEMENFKKRQERERADLLQFANENLLKDLLPVLDNLERALEHGRQSEGADSMVEGLELVYQDFLKVLGKFGVTPIDSIGQQFDPAYHHAVSEEEAPESADQTVIKELQKGYLLHSRLLRPAMVVVARNENKPSTSIDLKV